jgi:hypothetical protein
VVTPSSAFTRWLSISWPCWQVDESGSDHQPAGMDDAASAQRLGRDSGDLSVADANVADGIEAGFRIHSTSAFEHQIELLCGHNGG